MVLSSPSRRRGSPTSKHTWRDTSRVVAGHMIFQSVMAIINVIGRRRVAVWGNRPTSSARLATEAATKFKSDDTFIILVSLVIACCLDVNQYLLLLVIVCCYL